MLAFLRMNGCWSLGQQSKKRKKERKWQVRKVSSRKRQFVKCLGSESGEGEIIIIVELRPANAVTKPLRVSLLTAQLS